MRRIYDTFMFRDELDVLECRLTELQDEDVTHVLVEATLNHQGRPKPLHYQENRDRFARWNDRIIHVTVDDLDPGDTGAWGRENAQREATRRGLADADPGDVIIHSDCDEILAPHAIRAAREMTGEGLKFRLRHFIFACDWEIIGGELWDKPAATRLGDITSFTDLRRTQQLPRPPRGRGVAPVVLRRPGRDPPQDAGRLPPRGTRRGHPVRRRRPVLGERPVPVRYRPRGACRPGRDVAEVHPGRPRPRRLVPSPLRRD